LQDPNFQETVKRNITSAADTVQKTGLAGYQAIGKQVSTHTGVQLPGATSATSPLGSPQIQRKEEDYDDFWEANGIKEDSGKQYGSFARQTSAPSAVGGMTAKGGSSTNNKNDDEWESW